MLLKEYMDAVVAYTKQHADFLKDVDTHGRILGATELEHLMLNAPACRIGLLGTRGGSGQSSQARQRYHDTMGRASTGQFRGPVVMVAFLIHEGKGKLTARDRVIDLADEFMQFAEQNTFGMSQATEDTSKFVGPAMITGFEVMYSPEIDQLGAAVAAVGFEQEIWFGRNLHGEDLGIIQPGMPHPDSYTEADFENLGITPAELDTHVQGTATGGYTGQPTIPDTEDYENLNDED